MAIEQDPVIETLPQDTRLLPARATLMEEIRARLELHWRLLEEGKNGAGDKAEVRLLHAPQKAEWLMRERRALEPYLPRLLNHFAIGREIRPDRISARLRPVVSDQETGRLFRLAATLWSVPVSPGYGRRLRYLVEDEQNGKIIGIFALGDPVAGLAARDRWIGWDVSQRRERLSSVLDAYVCGAVPPYSTLLGGKLVVAMLGSSEVTEEFDRRYRWAPNHWGIYKHPRLALITVSSALGRSSLYNRVRLPGLVDLVRLEHPTKGWGHFQIPRDVFEMMRDLLALEGHPYADGHRYGDGPNWRLRTIREALKRVGLEEAKLKHGVARELFAMPLATNWREYLLGESDECVLARPPATAISKAAIERWVIPRSSRMPEWSLWSDIDRRKMFDHIANDRP